MGIIDSSRLLALPFEVRRMILRDLLQRPEYDERLPIHRRALLPKVHIAILSTCRQLHAEGLSLLYSHTLHFEIFAAARLINSDRSRTTYHFQPIYLGRGFTATSIPPLIAQHTSHVNIQVHARRVDGVFLLATIQDQVREVRKLVTRHPNWQHFTVRAYTSSGAPLFSEAAHVLQPLALQPFRPLTALRRRSSVVCDGVDPDFAAELARTMTSDTPVGDDIDDMYDELEAVMEALAPAKPKQGASSFARTESDFGAIRFTQDHSKLQDMTRMWAASRRDYGDLPGFVTTRISIVRKLKGFLDANMVDGKSVRPIQGDPVWVKQELDKLLAHDERYGSAPAAMHG